MLKNRFNINKSVISDAFREGWHDSLYYYILIKNLYRKPIIYNFSVRKVASLIGVAPSTTSKHIKILLEKNLAHVRDGNLCLYSVNKINANPDNKGKSKSIINLDFCKEKRKMIDQFRSVIIIQKLNNQIRGIAKRSVIVKNCKIENAVLSKAQLKCLIKSGGSKQIEKTLNHRVTLSNRTIGLTFNRSQSSGKLYQKRMNYFGYIRSSASIKIVLENFSGKQWLSDYPIRGVFVTKNNELARQNSNTIGSPFTVSYQDILSKEQNSVFFIKHTKN
jgi:DNA-binding transcriptional ArsR family regulator